MDARWYKFNERGNSLAFMLASAFEAEARGLWPIASFWWAEADFEDAKRRWVGLSIRDRSMDGD